MAIFLFFNGGRPASWVCYACLDHPQRLLSGLYRCAKFGSNGRRSFEGKRVSMLCEFGLKMPIHAPFGEVLGVK